MPVASVIRRAGRRLRSDEAGLTLSELLVVLVIMSLIIGGLVSVLTVSIRQNSQIQEQSTLETEVRGVVDSMVKELRQAYTGDGTYPVLTATSTTLEFLSPDKATPYHERKIAYSLTGGQLKRALSTSTNTNGPPWSGFAWSSFGTIPAGSWQTTVSSIKNAAVFSYFDASGNPLTGTINPSSVGSVQITVTTSTLAQPNRTSTYTTSASLRSTL